MTNNKTTTCLCTILLTCILAATGLLVPLSAWASDSGLQASGSNALQVQSNTNVHTTSKIEAAMDQLGIDVSVWNGSIDWATVARNVKFAIVRCGYGNDESYQDDKQWLNNVKGCTTNGVPMGVYLYSYATNVTMAVSEAQHVVRCLREAGLRSSSIAFPIYLDMEDSSTYDLAPITYAAIFNAFRATLNASGYQRVGIYSSASWWENKLTMITLPTEYRWVAHWNSVLGEGFPRTQAVGCGVWQYSSSGAIPGISGRVDVNWGRNDLTFLTESNASGNLYRLYAAWSSEHLYTTNASERNWLETSCGWRYEGVAWTVPDSSDTPVFRMYSPGLGDHHYTADASERNWLMDNGWNYEGIAWFATNNGSEVYRLYNGAMRCGQHHFTADASERDWLIQNGWRYEGVAFHGA